LIHHPWTELIGILIYMSCASSIESCAISREQWCWWRIVYYLDWLNFLLVLIYFILEILMTCIKVFFVNADTILYYFLNFENTII